MSTKVRQFTDKIIKISVIGGSGVEELKCSRCMEELLNHYMGKKVDVSAGTTAVYRGEVVDVRSGILYLKDDDGKVAHIAIDKIAVLYECSDSSSRPGFIV
jgi:hypothetical protein